MLDALEDQARSPLADLARHGDRLAFTTDSYVVDPLFFPGGDIGTLAVAGTVNDLAVSGARPLFLSCGMVLEEGLDVDILRRVAASMQRMADQAGVAIVTGDTKVVERGAADKLFINTAGIGVVPRGRRDLGGQRAARRRGDRQRRTRRSRRGHPDRAQPAGARRRRRERLPAAATGWSPRCWRACPSIHCLRDATRGGIATVLNEFAQQSRMSASASAKTRLPMRERSREPAKSSASIRCIWPTKASWSRWCRGRCRPRAGGDACASGRQRTPRSSAR